MFVAALLSIIVLTVVKTACSASAIDTTAQKAEQHMGSHWINVWTLLVLCAIDRMRSA